MELNNLLDFQKTDIAYKKIKDELAKNENYRVMAKSKDDFEQAKQRVASSEVTAEAIINAYNSAVATLNENLKEIDKLCAMAEKEDLDDEAQAQIVEKLETLRKVIESGEKKTAELKVNADKALNDYKSAQKVGKEAKANYTTAKEKFESFRKSKDVEIEELKKERSALKEKLDPELYELYKAKTSAGLYPALVPAMESGGIVCGGCGMQQSDSVKNALESKGYCECESCHRIIYKI